MPLTREQFQELRNQGLSVDQIVGFEQGKKPQDLAREKQVKMQTAGNQFEQEKPTSFLGKAKNVAVGLFGGGYLAEGAGKALAAPGVNKMVNEEQDQTFQLQQKTLEAIRNAKAEGRDTTRLENSLKDMQGLSTSLSDTSKDFADSLPSNKQVIGSAVRLGATALTPAITGKAGQLAGISKARTFGQGALRGAAAGAGEGALLGGAHGAGAAAEANATGGQIALAGGGGALGGGLFGGALGAIGGGFMGKIQGARDPQTVLNRITPKADQLTPTSYEKLLEKGRVSPRTATEAPKILLSKHEKATALKYKELLHDDPVQTTINIKDKILDMDDEVGKFLKKNNGIFNKGELKNKLTTAIADIDDISIDETRLNVAKERLVKKFVDSLEKGDTHSLWIARKEYDDVIDSAFRGAPSASKQVKIALRNAVQDFIGDATPGTFYKDQMRDMSGLFKLHDLAGIIARKERGLSKLMVWAKSHPTAMFVSGGILTGVGTALALPRIGKGNSTE